MNVDNHRYVNMSHLPLPLQVQNDTNPTNLYPQNAMMSRYFSCVFKLMMYRLRVKATSSIISHTRAELA